MKIGIIGAMEEEIKALREQLISPLSWERGGALFISGSIGNHEVIVVRSGIGKVLASITTSLLIQQYGVNMVINTGSAGGIGAGLQVGDLVISDKVAYFDVDVTGFGYEYGQLPGGMPLYYEASRYLISEMTKAAEATHHTVKKGLIVTGDSFIHDPQKVQEILGHFPDALASEMEGAAIAQVCHLNGTPYVIIRAISDDSDGMTYEEFQAEAARECAGAVLAMLG